MDIKHCHKGVVCSAIFFWNKCSKKSVPSIWHRMQRIKHYSVLLLQDFRQVMEGGPSVPFDSCVGKLRHHGPRTGLVGQVPPCCAAPAASSAGTASPTVRGVEGQAAQGAVILSFNGSCLICQWTEQKLSCWFRGPIQKRNYKGQ